ncbi:MAG: hypothetical protein P9L88_02720 [Candidatus Tantalella remota]|nr:hypothetical protein [Candidatus Tantalella remota]
MNKDAATERSLTEYAKENIESIHRLSRSYNGSEEDHSRVLLLLAEKHVKEIEELYAAGDDHFSVEVGDLMILCLELLEECRKDPDTVMEECYGRYKRKLSALIKERGNG